MPKPKTKTNAEIVSSHIKKTYKRIEILVRKETAETFKVKCKANGTNANKLINEWIKNYIENE